MLLVAVTGGIGSGKSSLAGSLAKLGAPVVDADRVARQVVEPGGPAYEALLARFGPGIRTADGAIDRPALAAIAFNDEGALADLNRITHPVIGAEVIRRIAELEHHDGPVVLDVPLLNATSIRLYRVGALVVVDTPEEVALQRLVEHRGFTEADARSRIAAQSSRAERRALLDLVDHGLVVDNSGGLAALERICDEVWHWLDDLMA